MANVIAGIVLTFTRAFGVGDQVEVGGTRGRVIERSTFVTRIQTLKNVVVSIPNSMVLNNNIINYSKNVGQSGLVVHTTITIGYDVPWQTVSDLLIAAASKTEGIVGQPEPFVLQTSLDDNYVSYEVNGWTRSPEELPRIYSNLHANILDEFHGHNVEITSPVVSCQSRCQCIDDSRGDRCGRARCRQGLRFLIQRIETARPVSGQLRTGG